MTGKTSMSFAFLAPAAALVICALPALAQQVQPGPGGAYADPNQSVPSAQAPSQFLLEPEVQIKGDEIKRQTYRSQHFGENNNWDLDIGRFQPPVNEDPNKVFEDPEGTYSGMRLRLPFRGRTGE